MKTRVSVLLMLAPLSASAGFESMMNPMMLANPVANPLTMAVPLGGAMMAPGLIGSPLGGFGSPLAGALPIAGMGVMQPAMQVAPNLMSFQHQAPQLLTNPYMGGPLSQLPFTQSNRALPFAPTPGYGTAFYPQAATPSLGGWPFASQAPVPVMPMNPYLMPPTPPAPPQGASLPFNPLDLLRPAAPPAAPAPQAVAPVGLPFISPWGTPPAAAPVAQTPPPAAASVPFSAPWLPMPAVAPQAPAAKAAPPAPASVPFSAPWLSAPAVAPQAPASAPQAAVAKQAPATTPAFNPADLFKQVAPAVSAAATPTAPVAPAAPVMPMAPAAPQAKAPAAAPAAFNPFDPAYWLAPVKTAPTPTPAK
jgi:hypothetical protein